MARKIQSSDNSLKSLVDVFEAVKRAMIRQGRFRQAKPEKTAASAKRVKNTSEDKLKSDTGQDPQETGPEELIHATVQAQDILFKADSVFPFVLFPDTITLDREKVTIAERFFWRVAKITSVPVRDILSIEADVGPFFGSIKIASRYFITNPQSMNFLWRKEATELRQLLQGYIIAHEREIDTSSISKEDLIELLKDLGKGGTG